jgi:hypothetical protein
MSHFGDRLRSRRHHPRRIRDGDAYTVTEERDGLIEREEASPRPEPPVAVQGEPWGWTKGPPYPEGWREDGRYPGQQNREDPGPLDGRWPGDE